MVSVIRSLVTRDAVLAALRTVIDPEIRRPITDLDMVDDVAVGEHGDVDVRIKLTIVGCPAADAIERDVLRATQNVPGVAAARVHVGVMSPDERRALTERLRGGRTAHNPFGAGTLTQVYAVTSGKGGVGKSTVTANLAVALAQRGLSVGLVDADVYGFSIPGILGLVQPDGTVAAPTRVGEMILPPVAHGVKVVSMGMFVSPGEAVAWRGPMLHRTLSQFLTDVWFGDLDVLLLDLPPGTGDIAISLGQLVPDADVLVITTPQAAAAEVAERSAQVARKIGQRVIGVIENMAGLVQPDGTVVDIFGSGGGAALADRLSTEHERVELVSSVPLSVTLRESGDAGSPVVLSHPQDPAARALTAAAEWLASRGRSLAGRPLGLQPRL